MGTLSLYKIQDVFDKDKPPPPKMKPLPKGYVSVMPNFLREPAKPEETKEEVKEETKANDKEEE